MLSIILWATWSSVCLLWRNIYLVLLLIFIIGLFVFFDDIDFDIELNDQGL